MKSKFILCLLFCLGVVSVGFSQVEKSAAVGAEPVEEFGYSRGRICLNGVWKFQPARGSSEAAPVATAWGSMRVPGSWLARANFPGGLVEGSGECWRDWSGEKLSKGWYERSITIPKEWAGRTVLIDLQRVSTDAVIYLDGKECGRVNWPDGMVDVTPFVKPGETYTMRVMVLAVNDRDKVLNAMGVGQNTMVDAKLATKGIIGEVFLRSRPLGARIEDVWVRTSTRKNEISVEADLTDVAKSGPVKFEAKIKDKTGAVVKSFTYSGKVAPGASTVVMSWPWADAKRWEVGQPNLYTLDLSINGEGFDGGFTQTFGFREIWVEGKTIYFNGTPFRLRPTSSLPEGDYCPHNGMASVFESAMDNILASGFNCVELWPSDHTIRGTYHFRELISELADKKGLPLMGPILHAADMFGSWEKIKWMDPDLRAGWERRLRVEWRRYRNSPSIVIWSSSGNIGGHTDDQDPRLIGRNLNDPAWAFSAKVQGWWNFMQRLEEMVAAVKQMDPTRPMMIHQGGPISDIYAINNYLCLIPLQEREEWLSDWSQHGTRPYCAVEFGPPLSTTMNRGRDGYVFACTTEWLMTEFCAVYLGKEAYRLEQPEYRREIISKYKGPQLWDWPNQDIMDFSPALQQLEKLFVTNTWRSWRTMGVTGGMIAWGNAHGFKPVPGEETLPPAKPGQRGAWYSRLPKHVFSPFGRPGVEVLPGGEALLENNAATLAWICGPAKAGDPADFTVKDHSFLSGSKLAKRVALLNDSRSNQNWNVKVTASVDGKTVGSVEKSGKIAVGETAFVPLEFLLPAIAEGKGRGEIVLEAKIGENQHADKFSFHVFAPEPKLNGKIAVFDPAGETSTLLKRLGYTPEVWKGGAADILVIGRKALSGGAKLPGDLESYVQNGGRLLIMTQDPDWMRDSLGLRVAALMTRRVFRMDPDHPVVKGLDEEDLRDWTGSSTLLEERPDYLKPGVSRLSNSMPTWGWRWGGRGTVSSATVEKPHCAGWRPLLECEFDLAYSTLMELDFGKGKAVLCTFDLEEHAALDPAADRLARNIVEWLRNAPLSPRVQRTLYVGGDEGARLLDLVGCDYQRASSIDPAAPLVIIGPDVSAEMAAPVLAAGGKVLVLPRRAEGAAGLGVSVTKHKAFVGSLSVPAWPEARGLTASDLRWRVETPALLLTGGDVAADGLLSRVKKDSGVAIFCQSDPLTIPADQKTYLRFTRWRMTRTLTQIIANLGGTFSMDNQIFQGKIKPITLTGKWKSAWTKKLASTAKVTDSGISEAATKLTQASADENGMEEVQLPGRWKRMVEGRGEVVFRRHFTVPSGLVGKELSLDLGPINAFDTVFINGQKIGNTGAEARNYWTISRVYRVPADLLKEGDNVIAIRIFDDHGGGNIGQSGKDLEMASGSSKKVGFYHPDYRSDFILGDDPYRYFRW